MGDYGGGRRRFKSPLKRLASMGAQRGLLKPALNTAISVHVSGTELLKGVEEPFLLVANHSSHFDGPLLMTSLPARLSKKIATGAAADYFFTNRFSAATVELFMNAYPVNRGATRSHRGMSKQLLNDGIPLMIFPEGTRSRTGAMGPFSPGTAALAISFNCQVVPAALVGAFAAWPAKNKRWKSGRPDVYVTYGNPLRPQPGEVAHAFSERIRRKVIELHDSTARAYNMPTQLEMANLAALEAGPKGKKRAAEKKKKRT
ncbi:MULTISPECIES: lysophospholipid acyltransferase family protein [Propionimicrobium]|uniref:1-acylglycerol-3-phosphate O-acyltransferase n=1 Tax=Propionimicrobium lymphophilum ACS-093-V-SCH5 TaxID=883161 RepID=S2W321_9ACTN|nr:1-acylglycerol-3-phosphate O-acyltransferase [Propionimicrobium lymphophilum ACS-093-V-SCH5]ETJ97553.1 acyltransferase [Propionimicrobium sp. BV2F7]